MLKLGLVSLLCITFGVALHVPNNPSVWKVFGDLAVQYKACNLGQGFPDWDTPPFVLESLRRTVDHQYANPSGYPKLAELIAQRYSTHLDQSLTGSTNVAITVGASQALYLALQSLLRAGDEIIMFDPYFELYAKQIALTAATPVFVPLGNTEQPGDPWALNILALRSAITSKTKVLLLNSPHNPTGKVFSAQEMRAIADVVREHPQLVVISDEVYKYTIYNVPENEKESSSPPGHHHFARLPGMWDRTVTISSAGKTFSVTGWQVGWMVGPQRFVAPVQQMLPCVQFCAPTPLQEALSYALVEADRPYEGFTSYYEWLRAQFTHKRGILEAGLCAAGIEPLPSTGGYFLMGRLPDVPSVKQAGSPLPDEPYDWKYCRHLAERYGVIGIPASPFFSERDYATSRGTGPLARFAFCKKDETLREAARRLQAGPIYRQTA